MPRIKVFTANLGFYETSVAARSQKIALAHWGVTRNLFREGNAKESNDPRAIEAAMRKVGLVVRRPIGSGGPFEERTQAEQALLKSLDGKRRLAPAKKPQPARMTPTKAATLPKRKQKMSRR